MKQALFCKVNLAIFESRAFDCHTEPKLTGKDTV